MKVLTPKLLTALRVKMSTYYGELEKERRSTDSLEGRRPTLDRQLKALAL